MKLILLPGMDGTGKLFEPMLSALPPLIEAEVITLSSLYEDHIKAQADEVAKLIGDQEVVIFAESYSGLIAYELAQIDNLNIKHIVFAASFLSRPSYLSKFGAIAPLFLLRLNLVPTFFLSWFLFGSCERNDLVQLFNQALELVTNSTLKARLKTIAALTEPKKSFKIPCTYIQATKDKLVSQKSMKSFQKLCINLNTKLVNGGHFIAQSNPEKCVEVIVEASGLRHCYSGTQPNDLNVR
jgi:pimeloyl-ACP methyl ester carboxylesterase